MGRTKLPRVSTSSGVLSEEKLKVLEQAASILDISVEKLLSGTPRPVSDATQAIDEQPNTRAVAKDLDIDDTRDEIPSSPSPPTDSEDLDDIVEWQTSAADFRHIDEDIPETYMDFTYWVEDALQTGPIPAQGLARAATIGFIEPDPTREFVASHPVALPTPPQDSRSSARAAQDLALDIVGSAMVDQMTVRQTHESDGWAVLSHPGSHQQLGQASEVRKEGELQIIAVDPLQRRAQPRQQRRKPYDDRERQEDAGKTRGLKACVRCRMQKIRCVILKDNPKGVCGTCQALSTQKVHYLPCLRHRLTESILYRTGKAPGLEFTFRWPVMKLKDIDSWASPDVRTILVESDVCPVPLQLSVREFVPVPGKDSLHRSWMDHKRGIKKTKETTPYAIVDMQKALLDMRDYVNSNVFSCMDFFLKGSDKLVKETYAFARKHMQRTDSDEERKLLGSYFRLWFAIRRTATMEHIVGPDKLDMTPEMEDQSCPLFEKIPLPPVMIQQLDMILTLGVLQPLQKQVLEDYQKLVLANSPRNWMTVYLVTFMSLHSCAKISEENYNNARKQGLLRRYSIPNFIQERHHAANVFLSHYHYRTESANPFIQDWRKRHATPFSHMTVEEIHFLKQTKLLVDEREQIIKTNNELDLYEHELYFISQMFEENWQPRDTTIDRTDGTVNNVGLKKYAG